MSRIKIRLERENMCAVAIQEECCSSVGMGDNPDIIAKVILDAFGAVFGGDWDMFGCIDILLRCLEQFEPKLYDFTDYHGSVRPFVAALRAAWDSWDELEPFQDHFLTRLNTQKESGK